MVENIVEKSVSKLKTIIYIVIAIIVLLFSLILFNNTSASKIKSIKVIGNTFLSDSEVLKIVDINVGDTYFFFLPSLKESKAKNHPLINNVDINLAGNNSVVINVEETKLVGYEINGLFDNSTTNLITSSGTVLNFKDFHIENLNLLPIFVDISTEDRIKIATKMANLDYDIIYRIVEINKCPFTYDLDMLKLNMDENLNVFVSIDYLQYVQNYLSLITNKLNFSCIYFGEYGTAMTMDCKELENNMVNRNQED